MYRKITDISTGRIYIGLLLVFTLLHLGLEADSDTCSHVTVKERTVTDVHERGMIIVEVRNIRSTKGMLKGCLFSSEDGYPEDYTKASSLSKASIKDSCSTEMIFRDVNFGMVAFVIIHDENNDGKLQKGFLFRPKEGFCFSNNAVGLLGPPSFKKASFDFRKKVLRLSVEMINN